LGYVAGTPSIIAPDVNIRGPNAVPRFTSALSANAESFDSAPRSRTVVTPQAT